MATKIDIISGFLGAGKTTLIKKLLKEVYADEQVVLIENEFGEIGIDGGFLKEAGIQIREMNSGCICCSLVGDFGTSLKVYQHLMARSGYGPDDTSLQLPSGKHQNLQPENSRYIRSSSHGSRFRHLSGIPRQYQSHRTHSRSKLPAHLQMLLSAVS